MEDNKAQPIQEVARIGRAFLHTNIIEDLQKNRIRFTGLPPLVQLLGSIMLTLLAITTMLMVFADHLRAVFSMIVISTDTYPNGLHLPSTAIGLVLFLFCMAWTFLLVAINNSPLWIKVPGVLIHLFLMGIWIIGLVQSDLRIFVGVIVILCVQTIIIFRQSHNHAVRNWVLIALCESIVLALPHSVYLQEYQNSGLGVLFTSIATFVTFQFVIITPMLFLVGISMAQTALNIADWSTQTTKQMPTNILIGVLLVCVVWRLLLIDASEVPETDTIVALLLYMGIFLVVVTGMSIAQPTLSPTKSDINDILERDGPWMIIAHLAPLISNIVIIIIFGLIAMAAIILGHDQTALYDTATQFITQRSTEIQLATAGCIALYATVLWRREKYLRSAFFGVTAYQLMWRASGIYFDFSLPNTLIEHTFFAGALVITAVRYLRGTLTQPQLQGFLFVTICSVLLLNADFLNNPLSPFLGFAGIVFIAIGVIWDVLFGSSWVNHDSLRYPRTVRLFFYLGYCLMMTIVAFWAVLSQETKLTELLTGEIALSAMHTFAIPLLHLWYCFLIFWPRSSQTSPPHQPTSDARGI